MDTAGSKEPSYLMEVRTSELTLTLPQPLRETLEEIARYRHCTVETLVLRLVASNQFVQKIFTRTALAAWEEHPEWGE